VSDATVWQTLGREIRIHPLSNFEFAVFNGLAWDSSVVNSIDASLLACLTEAAPQGISEKDLLEQASRRLDLDLDEMFVKYSQEALEQMAVVGLICKEVTFENR
jgi:hypothetical protein